MAYDAHRQRIVIMGGMNDSRLGDTWEWGVKGWSQFQGAGPSARLDAAMTFDEVRKVVVLFGGSAKGEILGDTWSFDGKRWSKLETPDSPPARKLSCMTYDVSRECVVLFGGQGKGRKLLSDTWEWDGSSWTLRAESGPSPRGAHELAFHRNLGRTFLYGGYADQALADFWEWDGMTWKELSAPEPGGRLHFAFGHDSTRDCLVLFGGFDAQGRSGDTWEWKGNEWSRRSEPGPAARAEHDGVAIAEGFAIFGGVVGQEMAVDDRVRRADLWFLSETGWTMIDGAKR